MENTMSDRYLLDKTIEALNKSVEANQSSAAANTRNATATEKLQSLAGDQIVLSKSLTDAVHEMNDNISKIVTGLETIAASQKVTAETTQKEKEKYFKYLTYTVVLIIVILGGGAALKIFFGFDLSVLFK